MKTFIIIIVIIVIIGIWGGISLSNQVQKAKENYEKSLAKLKENPTDADLKQATLELGRIYSNLTRDSKGVTTVDEIALMNDINAACAAASSINPLSTSQSIEDRLNNLSNLLEKGVISQLEYDSQRKEILDNI